MSRQLAYILDIRQKSQTEQKQPNLYCTGILIIDHTLLFMSYDQSISFVCIWMTNSFIGPYTTTHYALLWGMVRCFASSKRKKEMGKPKKHEWTVTSKSKSYPTMRKALEITFYSCTYAKWEEAKKGKKNRKVEYNSKWLNCMHQIFQNHT